MDRRCCSCWMLLLCAFLVIQCTATLYLGPTPPTVIEQGNDFDIFFTVGKTLILPCKASGSSELRFSWKKDGVLVEDHSLPNTTKDCNGTGECVLRFDSLQSVHQGEYQCTVTNNYGVSISHHIRLQQAVIGKGECNHSPRNREFIPGQFVKLPCCQPESIPPPTFEWTVGSYVDGRLETADKPVVFDKYTQVDENGTLYILEANEDTVNNKIFQCHISNEELSSHFGRRFMTSLSNTTEVLHDEKPKLRKAFRNLKSVVSFLGEDLWLQCIFEGRPIPDVQWSKPNHKLPHESHRNASGLFIHSINKEDAGSYLCEGTNYLGVENMVFNVDVQYRPYFVNHPRDTIAPTGKAVQFVCEAEGNPPASVTWYIDGVPIEGELDRVSISKDGSSSALTIQSVCRDHCKQQGTQARFSDMMVLQCNASNIHGYNLTEATLSVIDNIHLRRPPKNISVTGTRSQILQRPNEKFECEAVYNKFAPANATWYHNGTEILFKTRDMYFRGPVYSLNIDLKGLSKEEIWTINGLYKCKVDNSFEEIEAEAMLEIHLIEELTTAEALFPTFEEFTMSHSEGQDDRIDPQNRSKPMIRTFNSPVLHDRPSLVLPTTEKPAIQHHGEEEGDRKEINEEEGGLVHNIIFLVGASVGAAVFITCLIMIGVCVRRCGKKKRKRVRRCSSAAGSERYDMTGSQFWTLSNRDNQSITKSQLEAGDGTLRSFSFSSGEEEDLPTFLPAPPPLEREEDDLPPPPPPDPYCPGPPPPPPEPYYTDQWNTMSTLHSTTNMNYHM